jgi:hypothetical protein
MRMGWAGYVARMGLKGKAYRVLVGQPEGKRPLGRPRRRWVNNIVACRAISKQRPPDNQIHQNRFWVTVSNKYISTAKSQHAAIEEMLETVFSTVVCGGITRPPSSWGI